MDLGIGDIFNCRVAGNVRNADILGSMEFACKLAGAKVVLVNDNSTGNDKNSQFDHRRGVWANKPPNPSCLTRPFGDARFLLMC